MIDRRAISRITPSPTTRTMLDGAVPGLYVQWGVKGQPSWMLAYREGKRQIRVKLGFAWAGPGEPPTIEHLTIPQAREEALRRKREAKMGVVSGTSRKQAMTLEALLATYLDERRPKRRSDIERLVHHDMGLLLSRPVTSIKAEETQAIINRVKARAPIVARNLHLALQAMFGWAVRQRLMPDVPLIGDAPAKSTPRTRTLSDRELTLVWNATFKRPAPLRRFARTLIYTGQRRQEVSCMAWDEIDLEMKTWTIPAARYKTVVDHVVPLTDEMIALLLTPSIMGECNNTGYVFSFNGGRRPVNVSRENIHLRKISGVDFVLHDLRRTARTAWSRLGIPREIRELLIHPKTGVEATYDRWDFLAEKRNALEVWTAYVNDKIWTF